MARAKPQAESAPRSAFDADWRQRHPQRAAEQRALRKQQARIDATRKYQRAGTPETIDKAGRVQQGALARLYLAGHISADQLAWSAEIRCVVERITGEARIGTVSLETRVDQSRRGGAVFERLGAVRAEVAYTAWRGALARPGPVLAMIVEDLACRAAEQRFHLRNGSARRLLLAALDAWPAHQREARRQVSGDDLLAAQARLR